MEKEKPLGLAMQSKTDLASSTLPHLPYISTRRLATNLFLRTALQLRTRACRRLAWTRSAALAQCLTSLASESSASPELIHSQRRHLARLLQRCRDISQGRRLHQQLLARGLAADRLLGDRLVHMYGRCGDLAAARLVFDSLAAPTTSSWNLIIAAYSRSGKRAEAVELYHSMAAEPDVYTFATVLGACDDPHRGSLIHSRMRSSSLRHVVSLQNAAISMYARCGCLDAARRVFEGMPERDVISWTSMIAAYARRGHPGPALELYARMDCEPDCVTFAVVLGACATLEQARLVHARAAASAKADKPLVASAVVSMYSRLGDLGAAARAFGVVSDRANVVCWTAMILAYAHRGHCKEALGLFGRMMSEGVQPDAVTVASVLGACQRLEQVLAIHDSVVKSCGLSSVALDTALLTVLARCGAIDRARKVFDETKHDRNVYCWTAMISAYVQLGDGTEALQLYARMLEQRVQPNEYTLSSVLAACCSTCDMEQGSRIHARIHGTSLASSTAVQNALLNMYAKCGSLGLAKSTFDSVSSKDVVTWNAMIAAYARHGHGAEALELYERMNCDPDEVTLAGSLAACCLLGHLELGKLVHARAVKDKLETRPMVQNALVNMYGRCGSLAAARRMFAQQADALGGGWSSLAAAYAHQGHAGEALGLYHCMQVEGSEPNESTFTSILLGCGHAGLLSQAVECFWSMQSENGIAPRCEHFLCLVDLLGRAGMVEEAEELIKFMPFQPDSVAWMSLLSSCRTHHDQVRARRAAVRAMELDPDSTSAYSLLSSVCTTLDMQHLDHHVLRGQSDPVCCNF